MVKIALQLTVYQRFVKSVHGSGFGIVCKYNQPQGFHSPRPVAGSFLLLEMQASADLRQRIILAEDGLVAVFSTFIRDPREFYPDIPFLMRVNDKIGGFRFFNRSGRKGRELLPEVTYYQPFLLLFPFHG